MNKKTAKLLTFAFFVVGATAIYLYFSKKKPKETPPNDTPTKPNWSAFVEYKVTDYEVNTKSSSLNIRQKPNVNSAIVGKLAKGEKFQGQPYSADENWTVVLDSKAEPLKVKGYVSSKYVG
jgi:uncharacterized protein YgiM (DUF1202 family)